MSILTRILAVGSDRKLKEYRKIVKQINDLEPTMQAKSDQELKAMTYSFKADLASGKHTLDDILPEAFALVREASVRTLGMRHYDEQLIAALALNDNMIAEAKTGSGKTLACTPAVYLNALTGHGVHVVTVNDYLAERDCNQMSNIYRFLGLRASCIKSDLNVGPERQSAYLSDIVYGTNSEFGFDYLRDNMITDPAHRVQREHHYAIVDEVDSILIDEARTPLIISGSSDQSNDVYVKFASAVKGLTPDVDFEMDEAKKQIAATETGLQKIEKATQIDIYADTTGAMVNHLQNALRAQYLFHRDQEYLVHDGEVLIVDEFTGRVLPGRRYSDGLHQAIEAKEGVEIKSENETLATITLQNYFRMYDKLAGMTGTAMTEDAEFRATYNLPVMVIPDHKPNIRVDHEDLVFATVGAKFEAIAQEVERRHAKGQPCLIGTVSIENSEKLSRVLDKHGLKHSVLNAKHHAKEAEIVAQAGRYGAITIATNMAGRGTDILLGGNPELMAKQQILEAGYDEEENPVPDDVREQILEHAKQVCSEEHEKVMAVGGLCIIGSERHESRRIDNQLRGRAGRQGDPGETQFWLSLDDDLIRLFAADKVEAVRRNMALAEMEETEPLRSRMLTKMIEGAQHRIEEINFGMRKHTLEYDDVMNKQRETIYEERNRILDGEDILGESHDIINQISLHTANKWAPNVRNQSERDINEVYVWAHQLTDIEILQHVDGTAEELADDISSQIAKVFDKKVRRLGQDKAQALTKQIMLKIIDTRWRTYLQEMDYLKTGIGLRGFGQRDPLIEYKREAYNGFESLVTVIYENYVQIMCHLEVADERRERLREAMRAANEANANAPHVA